MPEEPAADDPPPLGIFSIFSGKGGTTKDKSYLAAAVQSDCESTDAGSEHDVIDLTDSSEGEWESISKLQEAMDIDIQITRAITARAYADP